MAPSERSIAKLQEQALRADRGARLAQHAGIAVGRALLIVAILGFWAYASGRFIDAQSISDPRSVFAALVDLIVSGRVWPEVAQTVTEVISGYAAGAIAGAALAFAFATAPGAERVMRPFLLAIYSIPKVALAPLMVMWFGLGIAPKIILAGSFAFFVVFMNSVAGIQSVNRNQINIIRVMGARRRAVLMKVVLPTMVPFLLLGLRISIPEAMTGAVIGEFISASSGSRLPRLLSFQRAQYGRCHGCDRHSRRHCRDWRRTARRHRAAVAVAAAGQQDHPIRQAA